MYYTQGPWNLEDRGYKYIVTDAIGNYITRDICRMDGSTMATVCQDGNALLIAQSPIMFEALKELTTYDDEYVRFVALQALKMMKDLQPLPRT